MTKWGYFILYIEKILIKKIIKIDIKKNYIKLKP